VYVSDNPVANVEDVYVLDEDGQLLTNVRLLDQNGDPIDLGWAGCYEDWEYRGNDVWQEGDEYYVRYPRRCPEEMPFWARILFLPHATAGKLIERLRYGENPHQNATFYGSPEQRFGVATARQMQGKELSYNNIADADAAWECVKSFSEPACVIVKHANPCGAAVAASLAQAYDKALKTDPVSAFGGILAFNRAHDAETAGAIGRQFAEVVLAPRVEPEAQKRLAKKATVRVLEVPLGHAEQGHDYERVGGGLLVQTSDSRVLDRRDFKVITRKAPSEAQWADLLFAWCVAKYVKSNAIVFCRDGMTLGVGAGQMSRIDSVRIAAMKAESAKLSLKAAVVASDAFFPFRDGLDALAEAGAAAVIQPGGSVRDEEVVAAADEHGIAMVFTGVRHFRH
jgi:phosphoribosylaminoimidazolecarboxamide formyltransferase / IMP cyclohydrolase